jgi:uncharacterized protein (DUF2237 family)
MSLPKNVLGTELQPCSMDPVTGFYRDGCCRTGPDDLGLHLVCTEVTDAFLAFSKERGNDLSTPSPMYHFPGLKSGGREGVGRRAQSGTITPATKMELTDATPRGSHASFLSPFRSRRTAAAVG